MEEVGYIERVTMVTLEAMRSNGTPFITAVVPDSIAPDNTSLVFTVPEGGLLLPTQALFEPERVPLELGDMATVGEGSKSAPVRRGSPKASVQLVRSPDQRLLAPSPARSGR